MRVPTLEPQVAARGVATYSPTLIRPDSNMANAVANVGQAVVQESRQVERAYMAEQAKAKQEAQALTTAEASLQLEQGLSSTSLEFKKLKGSQASEARASAYAAMDAARQKVAEGIADPDARRLFLIRSTESVSAYRRQVDSHTLQEFDSARVGTMTARIQQALGRATSGGDSEDTRLLTEQVAADIKALHPDAAGELTEAFWADMSMATVRGMVAKGDAQGAAAYIEQNRKWFGGNTDDAVALVAKATAKSEAEVAAAAVVRNARQPDGFIDGPKALAEVGALTGSTRALAHTIVNEQVAADAKRKAAETTSLKNEARKQLNHSGRFAAIDANLIAKLESDTYQQSDYVRRLREDSDTLARRATHAARGGAGAKAAAKEQTQADELARLRFLQLSRAQQAETDPEDFVVGMGVSEKGLLRIGVHHRTAADLVAAGTDRDADRYTALAESEGERTGVLRKGKNDGMPAEKQQEFRAEAQRQWDGFVAANKRTPSLEEQKAMLQPLLIDVKQRSGYWFLPDKKVKGFEVAAEQRPPAPAAPAPGAKPKVKYILKDGKLVPKGG